MLRQKSYTKEIQLTTAASGNIGGRDSTLLFKARFWSSFQTCLHLLAHLRKRELHLVQKTFVALKSDFIIFPCRPINLKPSPTCIDTSCFMIHDRSPHLSSHSIRYLHNHRSRANTMLPQHVLPDLDQTENRSRARYLTRSCARLTPYLIPNALPDLVQD